MKVMRVKVNEDISIGIGCDRFGIPLNYDIELEQNKVKDKLCDKCKGGVDDMMKVWDRYTQTTPIDEVTIDDIEWCIGQFTCWEDGEYGEECSDYLTQIVNLELVKWIGGIPYVNPRHKEFFKQQQF